MFDDAAACAFMPPSAWEETPVSSELRGLAVREISAVLPGRADDLARLQLIADDGAHVIAVVGKYNHGKSSLLNELLGQQAFAVSDKRETVALAHRVEHGVRWLDAPGLDADVASEDDRRAFEALWLHADIRLFVHAAKEGELDARERALLTELLADSERSARQTLCVLTQADQVEDDGELATIRTALQAQCDGTVWHDVSSTRHCKGQEGGKALLVERSGIPALRALLETALDQVPQARTHEATLLSDEIRVALDEHRAAQAALLDSLCTKQQTQRAAFDRGLKAVIDKSAVDVETMLDALGTDHTIVPDTAKDRYASTAGKRERAHIQIAYSRACIAIDGFLVGHGVMELPSEQRTTASSINSVMIAVLGISVKFRKDLRQMFCEAAGHERLLTNFTHYYELSAARTAIAQHIVDVRAALTAVDSALSALKTLVARP
ncbi:GTPase [Paraburkholderia tropica]|uniref:GTPase n=1 Tax=Paraburkholderia tropica TaxID=92647 RepID=UPI002AAFCC4A|nr:GTPase [Paraburkholderia tropica]